jgi:glycosyltransferase involved in cell wall biosynthesis
MHYSFLSTGSWKGNASFVRLRAFGQGLLDLGHRVTFFLDDLDYNVHELELPAQAERCIVSHPSSWMQFYSRRQAIAAVAPDIVHFINPSLKSWAALSTLPRQKFICDWDEWPCQREDRGWTYRTLNRFLDWHARTRAAGLVVASRYLQQAFRSLGYASTYIPYATYLEPHDDGLSPFDRPTFVYMGNFYPAYDHDLLLEAARTLKSQGLSPPLVLLGKGPDLDRWRQFADEYRLDNVRLPGFTTGQALWRHLRHAEALLFPIRDSLLNRVRCPSKTYAYAQARRPVVTSRIGEIVQVLGEQATYIEPTVSGWTTALAQLAQTAHQPDCDYHLDEQTWSKRSQQLLELAEQVLGLRQAELPPPPLTVSA